ncbi:MAG: DMT family transporter [Deltaproteobacteria bacterium]|nr:DMT family transporter [Deltaproteobacteria bacterium]
MPEDEGLLGEISALACAFCWTAGGTLTKSVAVRFGAVRLNFWRSLTASASLWVIIPFSPGLDHLHASFGAFLYLCLSSLIGISIGDTIYIRGLKLIDFTLALPIAQSAMPLFTLGAAVLFLGEPLSVHLALGAVLVLLGIYLIGSPVGRQRPRPGCKKATGIALILLAALLWAASVSLLKLGLQGVDLLLANGIRMPVAAAALLPMLAMRSEAVGEGRLTRRELTLGAGAGIIGFGIGGALFLLAIRHAGLGKAAILTSSGPLWGLPLSVLLLKEKVTGRIIVGTVLVTVGIYFLL